MTLIINMGDYWVETFHSARANIGPSGHSSSLFNLDKPGRLVGVSACLDCSTQAGADGGLLSLMVVDTLNQELVYGYRLVTLRLRKFNSSPNTISIGANVMVILRR